jgi:ppGpp synthetase/RelA/SpoT-type nucleotidyltranferase
VKNKVTEKEFIERYKLERSIYESWGNYLKDYILRELRNEYVNLDKILKVPVSCRTKDIESLVTKAFYRKKDYKDPYQDITDKVGIRFVVMTERQVDSISRIIESCVNWLKYSKDVDYNILREVHPEEFDYQSQHYIVKNLNEIKLDEYTIPQDTPCEIQIRTLEQHAYAEVSHELFYKKNCAQDGKALRLLARTAAFNEQSDELFGRMYDMIENQDIYYNDFMKILTDRYNFVYNNDKLNRTIYDDIEPLITKYGIDAEKITRYILDKPFVLEQIKEKQWEILFNQPVVLVLYYLVEGFNNELSSVWQYTENVLDPIRADLGIATD